MPVECNGTTCLEARTMTDAGDRETYLIRLSVEDQRRFVELLLDPPAMTPAMERARAAHAELTQCRCRWPG